MNQTEAPPSTGLIAGKYQLVRMIGRGGMGSVWEARHISLGTPSAIKFIEAEYADSQEARSRFDKEAKAAATIQSKHAIQIYDHGVTEDGKPYIVMELLQGEPLDKRIDRMRMSLQDTARIIQQVSRGLARAHERGIIHRDLKPENIFLVRNTDDDEEVAKVLDFGIAKVSNSPHSPGVTSSTKTGAVLGTPFYMSPEQARGLRNVDHRTDVWSLGVIAYKCVTGKLPFDGESVGDLLVKICTAPIPTPSHLAPGLPASFDAWFMRALEREPDRRFGSVQELAEALGYAAGVGPRSAPSHPHSTLPTSSAGHGMHTPNGPHSTPQGPAMHVPTPPPGRTPFGMQGGYGGPPASMGSRTPQPGMTNAPFTSSQPVPGVPSGKGKVLAGIAIGLVVVCGTAGGLYFLKFRQPPGEVGMHVQVPPPPSQPATIATAPTEPASLPAPTLAPAQPAEPKETATATPANLTTSKPAGKTAPTKPTAQKPQLPPGPATTTAPTTTPPPAPTPTTTATTTPTTKKPNKADPGY